MDKRIIFSYSQFSAVANGLIWGNGLCRSSNTVSLFMVIAIGVANALAVLLWPRKPGADAPL
jgi:hypothetical protein